GDGGTEVDAGASFTTVARDAQLLAVDDRQTFLLTVRADGTYAQPLPEGEAVRISDVAERVFTASDGDAVVLWSPQDGGLSRTLWLWRPGTDTAIPLTSRARKVEYDLGVSFVAFNEYDEASGTNSVRVARTDTCTLAACPLWTALERPSRNLRFQAGGTTLLATDGTQAWLIDMPSGAVTELGQTVSDPVLSADGARYALFDAANHLQVFGTATRTLQWEQVWRDDATRKNWHVSTAIMTDVGTLILNIQGYSTPETDSVACDATGCRDIDGGNCRNWEASPGVVLCLIQTWYSPDYYSQDSAYLDGTGRTLVDTATASSSVSPAFSADLLKQAWTVSVVRDGVRTDTLWWRTPEGTQQSLLEGRVDSTLFTFTPDDRQVLFARALTTADGKTDHRLSVWDGQSVVDLAVLEGKPFLNHIRPMVRNNPPALYLTVSQGDGGSTSVIRAPLP
ncbi:hypothetical protein, partial [Corallococcus carmarthensis]